MINPCPVRSTPKKPSMMALPMVPAGAFYYEEGALNWSSLLPNIRTLVGGIESNAVEQMDEFLGMIFEAMGDMATH